MKKIGTFILIACSVLLFGISGNAQQLISANWGDTLTLGLSAYRGNIQWESSLDGENWSTLTGETNDSITIENLNFQTRWFRAQIVEGTCLPVYSDYIQVLVSPAPGVCPLTITDVDGNIYSVVEIAGQCWMQSNLRTSRYRDQSIIPNIIEDALWDSQSEGAWCHYNNNANYDSAYGKLDNWYAAVDARGLCPLGWHVPTLSEFQALVDSLGGVNVAGGSLKSTTPDWESPNEGATNASGFTALPAGRRGYVLSDFDGLGLQAEFWTSTESTQQIGDDAYFVKVQKWSGEVYYFDYLSYWGVSVRCKMDE
jgi:uncharacterized protein (TIGR02145 family)